MTHARNYRYSDAHVHCVDFSQESGGVPRLLEAINKNQVGHVMLGGVAVTKKRHKDGPKRPCYYVGDDVGAYWYSAIDVIITVVVKSLPVERWRCIRPFLTGFSPANKNVGAHIHRILELDLGLWQGIGEVFARHDDLAVLTYDGVSRADNEALARAYRLAAEFDLSVLLHANVTSERERDPLYLTETEEPLRNHSHVRSIQTHAGISMEIHRYQKRLDFLLSILGRLLQRYPNFYIGLSQSMLCPYLLDEQSKPDPWWLALVERFPQRFMPGSDVVGQFDGLPELVTSFDPFLDTLPEQIACQVAQDNFLAVLPRQSADPQSG